MNRLIALAAYFSALASTLAPVVALAQSVPQTTNAALSTSTPIFSSISDVASKACYAVDILFTGCIILTIVFVLLAAIKYITKGSDPKAVTEAHQQLMWAAIGFAVALVASIVPKVIGSIIGAHVDYPKGC